MTTQLTPLSITRITAHRTLEHIGRDATEADLDGYIEWLTEQLEAEYPGAEVRVDDKPDALSVEVEDEDDATAAWDSVRSFINDCFDSCPWTWVAKTE